jgi:hypothetical protein
MLKPIKPVILPVILLSGQEVWLFQLLPHLSPEKRIGDYQHLSTISLTSHRVYKDNTDKTSATLLG